MIAQTKKPVYGRHSYGMPTIMWDVQGDLTVGAFTSIAPGVVVILGGEHRTGLISNFPFNPKWSTAARKTENTFPRSKGDINIGSDVWVGQGVLILSGVTIGDGAVIGARAVIASDVPPYAVVVGNPGRVLRYRFQPHQIERLLAVKWWDWPDAKISEFLPLILSEDLDKFLTAAGAN